MGAANVHTEVKQADVSKKFLLNVLDFLFYLSLMSMVPTTIIIAAQ